ALTPGPSPNCWEREVTGRRFSPLPAVGRGAGREGGSERMSPIGRLRQNPRRAAATSAAPPADPLEAARAAGLRYVTDAMPGIRGAGGRDLALSGMSRGKGRATIVRLLETPLIGAGNEEYARHNHHYGLTTMHNRHADVSGATVHFHFRGKSGRRHSID